MGKAFADEKLRILSIDIEREEDEDISEEVIGTEVDFKEEYVELDIDVKIVITVQIPYGYDVKNIKSSIKAIMGVGYVSIKKQSNGR